MFGRRAKRPSIESLDHVALEEILRDFEDEYHATIGDRITSAEFYDLYASGAVGDEFADALRWAAYYELFRAQGQEALTNGRGRANSIAIA
jgi:hypothetical protein